MGDETPVQPAVVPLPSTTTRQQDITHAGQRRINLIWEITQAVIALLTVGTCMVIFVIQAQDGVDRDFPTTLSNMAFAVLSFYLARTNHQAIGGVGTKPAQEYKGR